MAGTSGSDSGTSGGFAPPARWRLDPRDRLALAVFAGLTCVTAIVNALTVGHDLAEAGAVVAAWEPWTLELTSALFWIALIVPLSRLLRRLRPPHLSWPAAALAVALVSLPVCAAHLGWFVVSRGLVYTAFGSHYVFDGRLADLVYEWRKDLLSVFLFAGVGTLLDRMVALGAPPPAGPPPTPGPFRLEVRDRTRTHWLAATEIERVEAAGNYVELHTAAGTVLHRATLAAVADQLLPHGFARIHRSRLVRRDAVTRLATTPSGDFEATLASGATVAGSRRFRGNLG